MTPTKSAPIACGLLALILAPMEAHTLWRPVAAALGSPTADTSFSISLGAVGIAALACVVVLRTSSRDARRRAGLGVLAAAAVAGALLGRAAGAVSLVAVGVATLAVFPGAVAELRAALGKLPSPPSAGRVAVWTLLALGCVYVSADLAAYVGDPWAVTHGVAQGDILYRHLCLSAYLHAAELVRAGLPNVYDLARIPHEGTAALPDTAAHMAPFKLDRYGYPPQFLLLPLTLITVVRDFAAQRALWICFNALLLAVTMWRVGFWVGARSGHVFRWAAPFFWMLSAPTFQAGNIQLTILALGIWAMLAFDEGREATGGALLAGVTLGKIAPGLLGVILLVQRRWRGVAWTALFAVAFTALTLAVTGPQIFVDFLTYHMPRLSSGEAFDFLDDNPRVILENFSPFGIPFKLTLMGFELDPWVWARRVAAAYTGIALLLTVIAGRRTLDRRGHAAVWLLVLTLAGLRSPMAPGYLLGGVFWAMALMAAEITRARGWIFVLVTLTLMFIATPLLPLTLPTVFLGQLTMHVTLVYLLLRRWVALDPEHPPHRLGGALGG